MAIILRSYCRGFRLSKRRTKCVIALFAAIIIFCWYGLGQKSTTGIEFQIFNSVGDFSRQIADSTEVDTLSSSRHGTGSAQSVNRLKDIKVFYKVKENRGQYDNINELTIFNSGKTSVSLGGCTLYFCSVKNLLDTSNSYLKLTHIDGSFYKIEPVSRRLQILPGQKFTIEHTGMIYATGRTDIMPNWFFVGPDNEVTLVENTAGEKLSFVANFTTKEQWKQTSNDKYDPYTPDQRYDIIGFDPPQDAPLPLVIPQPLQVMNLDRTNTMIIDKHWSLYAEKGLENEATYIRDYFQLQSEPMTSLGKVITLKTAHQIQGHELVDDEFYSLTVNSTGHQIEITGKTASGVFCGIQTLLSLADENGAVPGVTIIDGPRFGYRGMHLDVARNFKPKWAILRLLDAMSKYKLNKFHFHLSDDEGWRLEIPGLPELTEVGSRRCYDYKLKCLPILLGSHPNSFKERQYYTVKDYQEILKYANQRHIEVIPEFDTPSHSYAAIKSMEARYWKFKNQGNNAKAEEFLLTEFEDNSDYSTIQNFKDNTMNPCLESTYRFILHVVKSLKSIHHDIQSLKTYHFGGDEVPRGAWKDSPACLKLIEGDEPYRRARLREHFLKRVGDIIHSLDLVLGGWDDFFSPQKMMFKNKGAALWSWNNFPGENGEEKAYQFARLGYKVVLAHASHLYFDHQQEPDPEEHGIFWAARFSDTRKVFGYVPDFCKTAGHCSDANTSRAIHGITGCLWTETVRTVDQMDFMIFPRIISLAERAWHKAPWEGIRNDAESKKKMNEEWKQFSSFIVRRELPRLEKLGFKYRIPPPGVRFDGESIKVRTALPGLPVQFSKDGGESWHDVTKDTQIESRALVRTSSRDRQRASRFVEVTRWVKP